VDDDCPEFFDRFSRLADIALRRLKTPVGSSKPFLSCSAIAPHLDDFTPVIAEKFFKVLINQSSFC